MDLTTRSAQLANKLQRLTSEMEPATWPNSGVLDQYLQHLKSKNDSPKLLLLIVTTSCAVASVLWSNPVILGLASIPLFTFSLITLSESITAYRLSSGIIPDTEPDIQNILQFILNHLVDLTDPAHRPRSPADTAKACAEATHDEARPQ